VYVFKRSVDSTESAAESSWSDSMLLSIVLLIDEAPWGSALPLECQFEPVLARV
jgi:hypothetical protein